jgi:hypothetical protein
MYHLTSQIDSREVAISTLLLISKTKVFDI